MDINRNLLKLSIALLASLVILYISSIYMSRQDKLALTIDAVPTDAKITIDGKRVGRGTAYLKPGTYEIKASRDGFKDYVRTLKVSPPISSYAIFMEANSTEGKKWLATHQNDYVRVRQLSEEAAQEYGENFARLNPITKKLPYRTFMYTIGYRNDPSDPSGNSIIIEIDAGEGYREAALYRIRQLGYDPTDFTINFRDYENPFPL